MLHLKLHVAGSDGLKGVQVNFLAFLCKYESIYPLQKIVLPGFEQFLEVYLVAITIFKECALDRKKIS